MPTLVYAVAVPGLPPLIMPDRFRTDVAYFMTPPGDQGVPPLPKGDYWIRQGDAREWLDAGVLAVVSPLDSMKKSEFELTEEQEAFLEWIVQHNVEHIRIVS